MPLGPVDFEVALDGLHDFVDEGGEEGVVVDAFDALGDGVVEGELFFFQAEGGGALVLGVDALLDLEHRLDHFRGFDQAVVVSAEGLLEELPEAAGLGEVLALAVVDFFAQELLEELEAEVGLGLVFEGLEEVVVEDRDVGALDAGGGEDVDHALALHRVVHKLADRAVELVPGLSALDLDQLLADALVEDDLVGVGAAVVEMADEEEGAAQVVLGLEVVVAALVVIGEVAVDQAVAVFEL